MSMSILMAKIGLDLHAQLLEGGPEAVNALFARKSRPRGFEPDTDLLEGYDYSDLAEWVETPDHPAALLFEGDALIEGFEWTYGAPMYFTPSDVARIGRELAEAYDWPFDEITSFLEQAAEENKGLIIGVG